MIESLTRRIQSSISRFSPRPLPDGVQDRLDFLDQPWCDVVELIPSPVISYHPDDIFYSNLEFWSTYVLSDLLLA